MQKSDGQKLKNRTILVVDDEPAICKLFSAVLKQAGAHVLLAKDGEEGLTMYIEHEQQIDIVLTDVVMPKMHGLEMAQQIQHHNPAVKIIFISGHTGTIVIPPHYLLLEKRFDNIRDIVDIIARVLA